MDIQTSYSGAEQRESGNYSHATSKEGAVINQDYHMSTVTSNGAEGEGKPVAETWKSPRLNIGRYLATLFCLFMLGANDASIGVCIAILSALLLIPTNRQQALIPYLETYYSIGYTVVATVFLSQVVGYTVSALVINKMHQSFGQLGIAIVAPLCKVIAYVVTCVHPPFPVIPVVYALAGFGNGLEDGAWNAWVGGLENANELLG
jgi:MFS family permease